MYMSNIVKRGHGVELFVTQLLSQEMIPQTATFIHNNVIDIVLQYIPAEGFVVGYQDKRVPASTNPIMMFADASYSFNRRQKPTQKSLADRFRDIVMNAPVLSEQVLAVKNDKDYGAVMDRESTKFELMMIMTQVCALAELHYDENSKGLGQAPIFKKIK